MKESMLVCDKVRVRIYDAKICPTYESTKKATPIEVIEMKPDLVVATGLQHILDLLIGTATTPANYTGVGSGTTAPSLGDTDLQIPITPRKQVTEKFRYGTSAIFSTFFGSTENNGTWNECGLFTAQIGGVMICRSLFSDRPITKDASKTITVDIEISIANA